MENKNFYAKPLENKYDYQNLAEARYTSYYGFKHIFLGLIMPVLGMCMILHPITEVYSGLNVTKVVISLFIIMLLLNTFLIMKYRDKAIKSLLKSWGKDK
ncbi:MAG: hypothetical protein M0R06_05355 [Sphaerochaeta sp.]|jgi:hypothetical protein|nr:hypothetical protein [Sphaerochaeta sp.]